MISDEAPFFYGEYSVTLDVKNRMLVPSEVRKAMDPERHGKALFVTVGTNGKPWMYAEKHYISMVSKTPSDMMPNDDQLDFERLKYGLCRKIDWDPQGRTVLPGPILKRADIGSELTLVGVRDHLELWPREAWDRKSTELLEKTREVELKAQLARLKNQLPPEKHIGN